MSAAYDIHSILQRYWNFSTFRPLQEEIITSVLEGNDTLALLPTGGGKSLCFQVPALARPGICLVISPLIALMKDQVDNLRKKEVPALLIHSGMQRNDVERTLRNATHDYFKFLYVSPERLETSLFREYLPALQVNLIAVDEAHCISQWGYDFRPSYLRIAALRQELPGVPVLALTASAIPAVQEDICEKLEFGRRHIFRQSFERKNLSLSCEQVDVKFTRLVTILQKVAGSAIVYCKSRRRTVEIARVLEMHNISSQPYHAGLTKDERQQRQQDWTSNKVRVMVSTNAFGMGIDKPDVRLVIHADPPDCTENYYQEAGRAGRDGQKAYAVLLFDHKDVVQLAREPDIRYPNLEQIKTVYQALVNYLQIPAYSGQDQRYRFIFTEFVRNFKLDAREAYYAIKALEQDGWLEFNERNFAPSTVAFQTNKSGLYEFERSHPEFEPLLTAMLRTYEGIFDFPVFISELLLARQLRLHEDAVRQQLKTVSSFGVLRYAPQNEDPLIIFRKHRVKADDLRIDMEAYLGRKRVFTTRTVQMRDYFSLTTCRSRYIRNYFGDQDRSNCGVCDNCLRRKATALYSTTFAMIEADIVRHLSGTTLTLDELLKQLNETGREHVQQVIDFMQTEQKLTYNSFGKLMLLGS